MASKVLWTFFAFLVLILSSAFVSEASAVPSIDSAIVYAAEEEVPLMSKMLLRNFANPNQQSNNNNNNSGITSGMVTDNVERNSFQGSTSINQDNDVIIGRCIDGHVQINDEDVITQTNIQSSNQGSDSGNTANDQGRIANNEVQVPSHQVARNMNEDNDLIFILGCNEGIVELNDNDVITQTNIQSSNQGSDSGNGGETDSE